MRLSRAWWVLAVGFPAVVSFGGCGGTSPSGGEPPEAAATSGGEDEAPTEADEAPREIVARGTVPVPVPQPAVPRDELSTALQRAWTSVESQVSIARPEGPAEVTVENVQAWADGPFRAWIDERRAAIEATHALLPEVPAQPPYERALALALFAYAFEDLGAQIAAAPMPAEIARDEELRGIYVTSLNEANVPLGQRAMELYADCRQRLAPLGDDSPWLPWRAYCVQRGQEIIRGYGLVPAEDLPPERDPQGD